ncbi:MAG: ABC transporter permease [Bacteroidota bacterium]|nr:ABC transporter permease [Chitinophagaceae bacterium]MCA6497204.1 ABC transporter permease [Chitinophagaceae bacterium]MCA6513294.1 ABC transporter permease [Chitinophagaceae bacterium]
MNLAFTIARKLAVSSQRSFAGFIIRLSVLATAVSVMALIITVSFVNGFQREVSEKVFSFWGHIRVQQYIPGKSIVAEELPMTKNDSLEKVISQVAGVKKIQPFATRSAVMEFNKSIEGVLIKGISAQYDSVPFMRFLQEGNWINWSDSNYSQDVLISSEQARLLNIHLKDTISLYFISPDESTRTYRKVRVCGIYRTSIAEYDQLFVIADLRMLQRVSNWANDQIGGYEVFVNQPSEIKTVHAKVTEVLPLQTGSNTIEEIFPNIFDWLLIQNLNRNVLFIILGIVGLINMATCLLVLILERTRMVGILQTLGAPGKMIRYIFLYQAMLIAMTGILLGCLAGLALCWLQQATGFIRLDEASYYVSVAPVHIIGWQILLIVGSALLICFLCLLLPTLIIRTDRPIQYIQLR